ncbi:MAG: MTH938/NDUFAF3 family protein [bacterium]|nr:MTH938/NDUFAF3 family protein [bacterium]
MAKDIMTIDDYTFGSIVIDGLRYDSDVKIFPDRIISSWWRKEGHLLRIEDIADVLESKPEVLIVGTGYSGCLRVPDSLRRQIADQGIILIVEETTKAWKTYNRLSSVRRVVAALHLTC